MDEAASFGSGETSFVGTILSCHAIIRACVRESKRGEGVRESERG